MLLFSVAEVHGRLNSADWCGEWVIMLFFFPSEANSQHASTVQFDTSTMPTYFLCWFLSVSCWFIQR